MSKADLIEANDHLSVALESHAAGNHSSVKRRIELARGCVQRAIDGHDPTVNPTAAQGAQTSDGPSDGQSAPRSYDPEVRRQQDQLRSCQIAYDARQRHLRGLR
jgi:hypothetical protein